jgi:hypothetical protein
MSKTKNFNELTKPSESKEYFTKYSLSKVTGLKLGAETYVMLLRPNEFVTERVHRVKPRVKGKVGFKGGIFGTDIVCTGYDEDGGRVDGAICCKYANDDTINELINYSREMVYLPVLVLGHSLDSKRDKYPISKLSLRTYSFAYIDISIKSFMSEIFNKYASSLKNDGKIDYDLEGEELQRIVFEQLSSTVIKVSGVAAKTSDIPYLKDYTFTPFSNTGIGSSTKEYETITNFRNNEDIMKDAAEWLALFDEGIDTLYVKNWKEEELTKYLVEDVEKDKNLDKFKKVSMESNNTSTGLKKPKSIDKSKNSTEEVELIEEDFVFDDDEEYVD